MAIYLFHPFFPQKYLFPKNSSPFPYSILMVAPLESFTYIWPYYSRYLICLTHTGVECRDTETGYRCGACPPGYTGDGTRRGCRRERPKCDSQPCYPGVACQDTREGYRCGACPAGLTGRPPIATLPQPYPLSPLA